MKLSDLDLPRSAIVNLTEEWILVARNKAIFYKKIEGYTYEEIAELYNLSTQRTKEIVRDCINRISKHI